MSYSIGAAAEAVGVPTSTVRYYDKEGLLPFVKRSDSGLRQFEDSDVDGLRMIECLKRTGMSLKDIRQFMQWCHEGDSTLRERRDMFYERREAVESQIEELRSTLDTIEYKCWFYDTAVAAGTDSAPREMVAAGDMPPRISKAHDRMMAR